MNMNLYKYKNQSGIVHGGLLIAGLALIIFLFIGTSSKVKDKHIFPNIPVNEAQAAFSSPRDFLLSGGSFQASPIQSPFFQVKNLSSVGSEVDLVYFQNDYYGVPWDVFAQNTQPPADWEWTQKMVNFASQASSTGKKVFLAMDITREDLAKHAKIQTDAQGIKKLLIDENEAQKHCYDFNTSEGQQRKLAYERYIKWMVSNFNPSQVNIAVEVNTYWESCIFNQPASAQAKWDGVKSVINSTYDSLKAANPNLIVFQSFVIADLYGHNNSVSCAKPMTLAACNSLRNQHYDQAYSALSGIKRDRFGISVYPALVEYYDPNSTSGDGNLNFEVNTTPADWFTKAGDRGSETTVIAETGWNTVNLNALVNDTCWSLINYSETEQLDYLNLLLNQAQDKQISLINWWTLVDLIPENVMNSCSPSDPAWNQIIELFRQVDPANPWYGEALLKGFGTMGFRKYDNTIKSTHSRWMQAVNTPLSSPSSTPRPGDIDNNGRIDIFDYNILLTNFGKTGTGIQGDLDGSGKVDIFDYNTLLTNFGK